MDHANRRIDGFHLAIEGGEEERRKLGQATRFPVKIQHDIGGQPERRESLHDRLPMLSTGQQHRIERIVLPRRQHDGSDLDGLGPGTDDEENGQRGHR